MQTNLFITATLKVAAIVFAVASLGACASFAPKTPEQSVTQRSQEYWDARIKGDKAKAYTYAHPSYKQVASEKDFALQFPGTFAKSVQIQKVECDTEKCTVGVNMKVTPPIIGSKLKDIDMYVSESWLLDGGQWWIYLKP